MDKEKENTGKIQLSFKDAKDLYRDYMNTSDKEKMNYLLTGTEYIVKKISKEYSRELKSEYDYDDIYSLTFEYYFKKLSAGNILRAKSFNDLFGDEYKLFIKNNLKPLYNTETKTTNDVLVSDASDSIIERIDKERLEEYADEVIRSLAEPESTALVATGTNVPMVVEKKKSYPLTTRGFSSVVIMGIITSIICLGIIVLGVYLVI